VETGFKGCGKERVHERKENRKEEAGMGGREEGRVGGGRVGT
jgi:hypothetical protein